MCAFTIINIREKIYANMFGDGDHSQQSLAINICWDAAIHN